MRLLRKVTLKTQPTKYSKSNIEFAILCMILQKHSFKMQKHRINKTYLQLVAIWHKIWWWQKTTMRTKLYYWLVAIWQANNGLMKKVQCRVITIAHIFYWDKTAYESTLICNVLYDFFNETKCWVTEMQLFVLQPLLSASQLEHLRRLLRIE